MARPDLKNERREIILAACERCFARFGVEGTTLERVASEAGLARALIRHNVGNREDLIDQTVARYVVHSRDSFAALLPHLPERRPLDTLVDWMFADGEADPILVHVSEALSLAAQHDPKIASAMREVVSDFVATLTRVIHMQSPAAPTERVAAVAAGVTALYFNAESLVSMGGMDDLHTATRRAARLLTDSL